MSKKNNLFDKSIGELVIESLAQATEFVGGKDNGSTRKKVSIVAPPDYSGSEVREIRMAMKYSQQAFSDLMGVSKKTVEAWESDRSTPIGPARRLISLIEKDAEHVKELIDA